MSAQTSNPPAAPKPLVNCDHPWLGLLPFTEDTRQFFFGREAEIQEIFQRVRQKPLTVLYGPSGLGKTSLLGAGLVPVLRDAGFLPVPIRLRYPSVGDTSSVPPPADQVRTELAAALRAASQGELASQCDPGPELWSLFHDTSLGFLRPGAPQVVLLFDQFEEVFTLGERTPTASLAFLDELADLVENRPSPLLGRRLEQEENLAERFAFAARPVKVVLVLREDYLSRLERRRRVMPSLMENRMELRLLNGPQALAAVVRPGRLGGPELVSEAVGREIVRAVAEAAPDTPLEDIGAVPPFLSLMCRELNRLRLESGAGAIASGLVKDNKDNILERFYADCFLNLPDAVRDFVEDKFLSPNGRIRESLSWAAALDCLEKAGVPDPVTVLEVLLERRLLTAEERGDQRRLELTHDILTAEVRKSRDRRVEAAEQKRRDEEQARRFAQVEAERAQAQRARKQLWLVVAALTLLTLLALTSMVWALRRGREAREGKRKAEQAQTELEHHLADSAFEQGTTLLGTEREGEGIARLAYATRKGSKGASQRLQSLLLTRSFPRLVAAMKHGDAGAAGVYSPDGRWVVPRTNGNVVQVFSAITGKAASKPIRHGGEITDASFSSDSKFLVTASLDKSARVWDAESGVPVTGFLVHSNAVQYAGFSPDGRVVATISEDNSLRVWDAATGNSIGKVMRHGGKFTNARFSFDGRWILTASKDKTARVWDWTTGELLAPPLVHDGPVNDARFSSNDLRIVTASSDKTARIWETGTGKQIGQSLSHQSGVNSAQFSDDGRLVVTAARDMVVRVWDVAKGSPTGVAIHVDGGVDNAWLSEDGGVIFTRTPQRAVRRWSASTGEELAEFPSLNPDAALFSARFSPDGQRVVTAGRDGTARVWGVSDGTLLAAFVDHTNCVLDAVFSPDGHRVVSVSSDHSARVWDAATGKPVSEPLWHSNTVTGASFSPDGRWVVTVSWDKTARVWDAATGKPVSEPLWHSNAVTSASFSPDGHRVVTASQDQTARVWEAATAKPVAGPFRHGDVVTSALFSPDGKSVLTGSRDRTVRLWDVALESAPATRTNRFGVGVTRAIFSPDGRQIAIALDDNTLHLWDAFGHEALTNRLQHAGTITSLEFSPDGRWLVTASEDKSARVWDTASGQQITEPMRHHAEVRSARLSPDGQRIVTASWDELARIWEMPRGRAVPAIRGWLFSLSLDGRWMLTSESRSAANFWEAAPPGTATVLQVRRMDESCSVAARVFVSNLVVHTAISTDGRLILGVLQDNQVQVWEAATGKSVSIFHPSTNRITSVSFSPDGRWVVAASVWDTTAWVWEAATGKPVSETLWHSNTVTSASFSPDGRWVVTADRDKTARVWEAVTGKPVCEPLQHDSAVLNAAFSPNSHWLVTASLDGTARLWEAATGRRVLRPEAVSRSLSSASTIRGGGQIIELLRHEDWVNWAVFSPDGRRVVTASMDKTARVWDAATGVPVGEPMRHEAEVTGAAFSPSDGRWVLTTSADGQARLWEAETGTPASEPLPNAAWSPIAAFVNEGRAVVTATDEGTFYWPLGSGLSADALTDLAELNAGLMMDVQTRRVASPNTQWKLTNFISAAKGSYLLDDSQNGIITPGSKVRIPDWIEEQLAEPTKEALERITGAFPAHPLTKAATAIFLATNSVGGTPERARSSARMAEAALPSIPDHDLKARISYWLSEYAIRTGELGQASNYIAQAVSLNPSPGRFWRQAARVGSLLNDSGMELDGLQHAVEREPTNALWRVELGHHLGLHGERTRAATEFTNALAGAGRTPQVWQALGWAWLDLGEWAQARKAFASTNAEWWPLTALAGVAAAAWLAGETNQAQTNYSTLALADSRFAEASAWHPTNALLFPVEPARSLPAGARLALSNVCASLPLERRYSVESLRAKAYKLYEQSGAENLTNSISLLDAALRIAPADPQALNSRGCALYQLGRAEEALAAFRAAAAAPKATGLDKGVFLANAALTLRFKFLPPRLEEALASAQTATAADTNSAHAQRQVAACLAALGRAHAAVEAYQSLTALNDSTDLDFSEAGYFAVTNGLTEATQSLFEAGRQRFPKSAALAEAEGWGWLNLGRPATALAAFQRTKLFVEKPREGLTALVFTNAGAWSLSTLAGLATAAWLSGETNQAQSAYSNLALTDARFAESEAWHPTNTLPFFVGLAPSRMVLSNVCASLPLERRYSVGSLVVKANQNLDQGGAENLTNALSLLEVALRIAPDDPQALNARGRALYHLGRAEEALAAFRAAAATPKASGPAKGVFLANAALTLRFKFVPPRCEEALANAQAATAADTNSAYAHRELAACLAALGRGQAAVDAYQRLTGLQDSTEQDFNEAGHFAGTHGLAEAAQSLFEAGRSRFPKSALLADSEGWGWLNLDRPAAALEAFQRAMGLVEKPRDNLLAGVAVAAWLDGKQDEALSQYAALVRQNRDFATQDFIGRLGWSEKQKASMEAIRRATLEKNPALAPEAGTGRTVVPAKN